MVPPVVVIADEGHDGLIQVRRQLGRQLVHVTFEGRVAALQLAVGLGVEGCCQYVLGSPPCPGSPEKPAALDTLSLEETPKPPSLGP